MKIRRLLSCCGPRPLVTLALVCTLALGAAACGSDSSDDDGGAQLTNSEVVLKVLSEGLGQGDVTVVDEFVAEDYVQHSSMATDGREGLRGFVEAGGLPGEVHRVLEDGDMVATHSTYTFQDGTQMVAFDVFRLENGLLAEHWDSLQALVPASETASGRGMTDGPTEVTDRGLTEQNRALVQGFVETILTNGEMDRIGEFIGETYLQHNPGVADGLDGLGAFVGSLGEQGMAFGYTRTPIVVADGNFVLTGSEGFFGPTDVKPFAVFYDLFRVENGLIVEHWDVIPTPAPNPNELPHDNGLF